MLTPFPRKALSLAALALWVTTAVSAQSESSNWAVDPEESFLAVVTHKEGVASGLANEHLVVAREFEAQLYVELDRPAATWAEVELPVTELIVDDPALNSQWQSELLERALIAEEFAQLKDKDRQKIRRSMLSKKQLDAENHPRIRARLDGVSVQGAEASATLHLELRGERVTREVSFTWPTPNDDGTLRVDLAQSFTFRDFGIKPYSALLGAIRVADRFDLVLRVVARPGAGAN